MDDHERANWERIRVHLEKVGATDSYFYKRAVTIGGGRPDPLNHPRPEHSSD